MRRGYDKEILISCDYPLSQPNPSLLGIHGFCWAKGVVALCISGLRLPAARGACGTASADPYYSSAVKVVIAEQEYSYT